MPSDDTTAPRSTRRALVVEDQTTFRELLSELLSEQHGYQVESSASGAEAGIWLKKRHFDLVLLDLMLPDMHGFELLKLLSTSQTRVLVLTAQARPQVVKDALSRGAHAVVTKGAPLRELRQAIVQVEAGGTFYSQETSRLLHEAAVTPERDERLTERQRTVLRAVASGLSTKEIASQLGLSEKTVANHRARIMERIGVHDIAGLTRYAVSLGLIDTEA